MEEIKETIKHTHTHTHTHTRRQTQGKWDVRLYVWLEGCNIRKNIGRRE